MGDSPSVVVIVVGPEELLPGDEIVGVQRHGPGDPVSPRTEKIVKVGAGQHPRGGECIQLRRRASDPVTYELNLWYGNEYDARTLFHIRRA
ncbi:Uncharacterised protein [Mycobacteroides abscessus subsp. massiliense]|nr:Uncharacterised protein [Mycobacteroides abscessus subsp. massiliense]